MELKLLAQPKQFHSLTVGVSATMVMDNEFDASVSTLQPALNDVRNQLSEALTKGINEEIKKLYGEANARAVLAGYFGQGGQV